MYDLVVIGGNLAGVSAAINAANKGISVALVEKNKQPINPAHCGEGLLDKAGELLGLFKLECSQNKINKLIINVASTEEYIFNLKKFYMIIFDRNCVENTLLNKAKKLGVTIMNGRKMIDFKPPNKVILDNDKKIEGKIIIDSSGISCEVGRRIGLKTKIKKEDIGVCIQSRVEGKFDTNVIRFWFHTPYAPWGYAWLFPINKNFANIGLGIRGGQNLNLDELLKKYLTKTLKDPYKILSTFKDCVPITTPLKQLYKDNVIITGDAARLADAIGAAGIRNAVLSGNLAGKVAANYIQGNTTSFKIYQEKMNLITKKLDKIYNRQCKIYGNEEKMLKRYRTGIRFLRNMHNFFPTFIENRVAKALIKDIHSLESYK
jgi:digeranylgeranylglycerophospholipid reductase